MFYGLRQRVYSLFSTRPRRRVWLGIGVVVMCVVVGTLGITTLVEAQTNTNTNSTGTSITDIAVGALARGISNILIWVASLLGKLLVVIIDIFIDIAQYNEFSTSPVIERGWTVVRDVANMFFVLVLLVIAFGTILKIESYRYQRLLPKLVIMAVLINFSKLIAGFFIDFSQVVMLTFVNAFADTAAQNFTSVLKLREMLEFFKTNNGQPLQTVSNAELIGAPLLAVFLLIIAIMVMVVMLVMITIRLIALWILVVLSPLAYLAATMPMTSKYSSQWWSTFGKWVTTGPILGFFLWLSLAVMTSNPDLIGSTVQTDTTIIQDSQISASITEVSNSKNMLGFMLGISMLAISLAVASSLGGTAGRIAGQFSDRVKKMGSRTLRIAGAPAIGVGKAAQYGIQSGQRFLGRKMRESDSRLLNMMTPEYWKGWQKRGERLGEEAKTKVAGRGEYFAERFFKGKDAAMDREEMADRQVIVSLQADFNKEMGAAGDSRQAMMDVARRVFNTGGHEGENLQQAFLELAARKGNLDDVYEGFASMYKSDNTMRQRINDRFVKNGYKTSEVEQMFETQDSNAYRMFASTFLGVDRKFVEGERDDKGNIIKTSREVAMENKGDRASQRKLRALAGLSETVKGVGHWEQYMATKDTSDGFYYLMDERERRDEIKGEAKKMGARDFLRTVAPHVILPRAWVAQRDENGKLIEDEKHGDYLEEDKKKFLTNADGSYRRDANGEYMVQDEATGREVAVSEAVDENGERRFKKYQHAFQASPMGPAEDSAEFEMFRDLFGGQHIAEMRQMQSRIADQIIGKYFDSLGNYIATEEEAVRRGFKETFKTDPNTGEVITDEKTGKPVVEVSARRNAINDFKRLYETNPAIVRGLYNLKYGNKADSKPAGGYPWEAGYVDRIQPEEIDRHRKVLAQHINYSGILEVARGSDVNLGDPANIKNVADIRNTLQNTDYAGQKGLISRERVFQMMRDMDRATKWDPDRAKPGKESLVEDLRDQLKEKEAELATAKNSEERAEIKSKISGLHRQIKQNTGYYWEDVTLPNGDPDPDRQYTTYALEAEAIIQKDVEASLSKVLAEKVGKLKLGNGKTILDTELAAGEAAAEERIRAENITDSGRRKEVKEEEQKKATERANSKIKDMVKGMMQVGAEDVVRSRYLTDEELDQQAEREKVMKKRATAARTEKVEPAQGPIITPSKPVPVPEQAVQILQRGLDTFRKMATDESGQMSDSDTEMARDMEQQIEALRNGSQKEIAGVLESLDDYIEHLQWSINAYPDLYSDPNSEDGMQIRSTLRDFEKARDSVAVSLASARSTGLDDEAIRKLSDELVDLLRTQHQQQDQERQSGRGAVPAAEKEEVARNINQIMAELGEHVTSQRDSMIQRLQSAGTEAEKEAIRQQIDELNAMLVNPQMQAQAQIPTAEGLNNPSFDFGLKNMEKFTGELKKTLEETTDSLKEFPKLAADVSKTLNEFSQSLGRASKDLTGNSKTTMENLNKSVEGMRNQSSQWAVGSRTASPAEQQQFLWSIVQLTKALKDQQRTATTTAAKAEAEKSNRREPEQPGTASATDRRNPRQPKSDGNPDIS
ncbi:MAG: hypothetical protein ACOYUK_00880 [Patescibacteria group bacterium]